MNNLSVLLAIEEEYKRAMRLYLKETNKAKKHELAVQLDFIASNIRPVSDYYE